VWESLKNLNGSSVGVVEKLKRKHQMSKRNEQRMRKTTYSQISPLENLEELKLHHNHEKFCF
jgi:hypothetical protein